MVDRGFDNSDIVPSDVKVKMFCYFKCGFRSLAEILKLLEVIIAFQATGVGCFDGL